MALRRLAIAVIVVGLVWSGHWFWVAAAKHRAVNDWIAAREAEGWAIGYSDLALRGFPNRLDLTLTNLTMADPQSGIVWEAPFFQLLSLSYRRGHIIAVWPETQTLSRGGQRTRIDSDGLRASVVFDAGSGAILRANLEADVLNLRRQGGTTLALAGLRVAAEHAAPGGQDYRLALAADGVVGGTTGTPGASAITADLSVGFDTLWTLAALHDPRPQPRSLAIKLAEYRLGDLELKLAGDLAIDTGGVPDGRLTFKAVNWRALLSQAREAGQITPGLADTLETGLEIVAQLSGNPKTLDLPLRIDAGEMFLGPIPLGPAPRLRLP